MKTISASIIILILFSLPAMALDTKTLGKLTMVGVLSVAAFVVKMLNDNDHKAVARLHKTLGQPDKIIEYQKGFDHWRLEWYGDKIYFFRNGVIHEPPK